jgi:hypothetical protein
MYCFAKVVVLLRHAALKIYDHRADQETLLSDVRAKRHFSLIRVGPDVVVSVRRLAGVSFRVRGDAGTAG